MLVKILSHPGHGLSGTIELKKVKQIQLPLFLRLIGVHSVMTVRLAKVMAKEEEKI